jgi:hypothetical protein
VNYWCITASTLFAARIKIAGADSQHSSGNLFEVGKQWQWQPKREYCGEKTVGENQGKTVKTIDWLWLRTSCAEDWAVERHGS